MYVCIYTCVCDKEQAVTMTMPINISKTLPA